MASNAAFSFDIDISKLTKASDNISKMREGVDSLNEGIKKLNDAFLEFAKAVSEAEKKVDKPVSKLRKAFNVVLAPLRKMNDLMKGFLNKLKNAVGSARLLRTYMTIQLARGIWDKATNFSDMANLNKKDSHAMNSSVKNIRAIDYAFDLWGSEFNRSAASAFQNNLSDVSKWGSYGALGISSERIQELKGMDGSDAFMQGLQDVIKRVNDFGGFDNETAKAALKGHIEDLGLNWEELKALNRNGRLNEINKTYEERKRADHRDYSGFEKFERIKKGFIQTLDDIWEGLVSKLLPIVNIVVRVITKIAKSFSEYLSKSDVLNKLSKTLEEYGNRFANWISKIDFVSVFKSIVDFIVDIPAKIKRAIQFFQELLSGLGSIVSIFDKEKGEKLQRLNPDYVKNKTNEANEAISKGGLFSSSTSEKLNELFNKDYKTLSNPYAQGKVDSIGAEAIRTLGGPLNAAYGNSNSPEFKQAMANFKTFTQSKEIKSAKEQGKDLDITMRWVGNEVVMEAKDKNTSQVLMRQAIMKRSN